MRTSLNAKKAPKRLRRFAANVFALGTLFCFSFIGSGAFSSCSDPTDGIVTKFNLFTDLSNKIVLKNTSYLGWGYGSMTIDDADYPIYFYFNTQGSVELWLETKDEFGFPAGGDAYANRFFLRYEGPNVLRSTETATIFGRAYERIELVASNVGANQFKPYEFVEHRS